MSLLRNILLPTRTVITAAVGGSCRPSTSSVSLFTAKMLQPYHPLQIREYSTRQMRTSTALSSQRLPASSESLLITDKAIQRLKDILDDDSFLRVIVESGGCSGFQYKFEIDKKLEDEDIEILHPEDKQPATPNKTILVIDPTSLDILRGSTVDYETELIRSAFRIINIPQAENGCSCGASFTVKID